RIRAGALGLGLPERDLMVSPQHRMLVRSNVARNMFGAREGLVAAKQLLGLDGIEVAEVDEATYVHFLCAAHEIVFAEGGPCGSLYTGAEALKSVGPAARREIFTLFPELQNRAPDDLPHSARPLIKAPPAAGLRIAWSRTKSGRLSCQ
ncbi:MAG: hemolysin, partial [Rhodobacteraceae bacterium]|nr:hemolysin [Paracoccaceae bacterium]